MNQRDRFEAWATKANFDVERYGISPGYQDTHTDDAWAAWQAAEAAAIDRCAKMAETACHVKSEDLMNAVRKHGHRLTNSEIRALLQKEES